MTILIALIVGSWLLFDLEIRDRPVPSQQDVVDWIQHSSIPFDDTTRVWGSMEQVFAQSRVIALGEATHGQHESFEIKRQLTMHLIRNHGFRFVVYEASAAQMATANQYVLGQIDDWRTAMKGFGMLIWQIDENRALLDDLRAWNLRSPKSAQVQLLGCDAQDAEAAMNRLIELMGDKSDASQERIRAMVPKTNTALSELMQGNPKSWEQAKTEIEALKNWLDTKSPLAASQQTEYRLRVREFLAALTMYATPGGRDQAMADLLLHQLDDAGTDARCVLWAHNGHVQRTPLAYLGSTDLAMGGHLADKLGNAYYAIGFVFGQGEFQANVQLLDGTWGFRRYRLSAAPEGSLEWTLSQAGHQRFLFDLRSAPADESIQKWLITGHGQRRFGGYHVADDCDRMTRDVSKLPRTTPAKDFDGLLYIDQTTAANPIDASRIWEGKR